MKRRTAAPCTSNSGPNAVQSPPSIMASSAASDRTGFALRWVADWFMLLLLGVRQLGRSPSGLNELTHIRPKGCRQLPRSRQPLLPRSFFHMSCTITADKASERPEHSAENTLSCERTWRSCPMPPSGAFLLWVETTSAKRRAGGQAPCGFRTSPAGLKRIWRSNPFHRCPASVREATPLSEYFEGCALERRMVKPTHR